MLIQMIRLLQGYVTLRVSGYAPERFLNLCSLANILVWDIENCGADYEMKMTVRGFRQIRPYVRKTKTKIMIIQKHGLPFFIFQNRKRKAFFLGIVLCAWLLWFLSLFIWDIRVEGGAHYTQELVVDALEEEGIFHGIRKSKVDCEEIQFFLREKYAGITWVSASIQGTRLSIQLREDLFTAQQDETKTETDEDAPYDLIAPADGVITAMVVRRGTPCFAEGDPVKAGDVLVSGVLELTNDSKEVAQLWYTKADADVWIVSTEHYENSVNRAYEQKLYSGQQKTGFYVQLLSRQVNVSPQVPADTGWERLCSEYQLRLLDHFYLPVVFGKVTLREYAFSPAIYTEAETKSLLLQQLQEYFTELEKKGVQITENDVKIQIGQKQGTASGTVTVCQRAAELEPSVLPEADVPLQ